MMIDSPLYITILVIITAFYYLTKSVKIQNIILLILSLVFYYYFSKGDILPILSIVAITLLINNFFKKYYFTGIFSIALIFIFFKYQQNHSLYLPIGLSFITFQVISLLEDKRRRIYKKENTLIESALYALYFPQIAAGPIEKASELISQFSESRSFNYNHYRKSLLKISFGILKKAIIANALWQIIYGFQQRESISTIELFLIPIFCRYFIFTNFSAYTDIALGTSNLFGIKLTENFNRPFAAKTLTQFWTRWHITLSNWIKSYILFPLAITFKRKNISIYFATIISFLIIGAWHGLTFHFLIYGLIQGLVISLESFLEKKNISFFKNNIIVNLFYRYIVIFIPAVLFFFKTIPKIENTNPLFIHRQFVIVLFYIFSLEIIQYVAKKFKLDDFIAKQSFLIRWTFYFSLVSLYFFAGNFNSDSTFLYFNF